MPFIMENNDNMLKNMGFMRKYEPFKYETSPRQRPCRARALESVLHRCVQVHRQLGRLRARQGILVQHAPGLPVAVHSLVHEHVLV